jgi:hypothetical protein
VVLIAAQKVLPQNKEQPSMSAKMTHLQELLDKGSYDERLLAKAAFDVIDEQEHSRSAAQLLLRAVNSLQDRAEDQFRASRRPNRTEQDFLDVLALLDRLIGRLPPENRMELATLWYRRGEINTLVAQRRDAEEDFARAHQLLMQEKADTDLFYVRTAIEHADAALKNGRKTEAAQLYRTVMSFPYYVEEDGRYMGDLQALYTRAGYGLLTCLRGDRAALEDVHFLPSADPGLLQRLAEERKLAQ